MGEAEALASEQREQIEAILADVAPTVKIALLEQKLPMWKNTLADAQLDHGVATVTGDDQMADAAKDRMRKALKAINAVNDMIKEFRAEAEEAD